MQLDLGVPSTSKLEFARAVAGVVEASEESSATVPGYLSTMTPTDVTPVGGGQDLSAVEAPGAFQNQLDAPLCHECGHVMVRNGSCYRCFNCGATSGCS